MTVLAVFAVGYLADAGRPAEGPLPVDFGCSQVVELAGGRWEATDEGLVKHSPRGVTLLTAGNSGLLSNRVRDVRADGAGHLWIATDAGVSVYDGASGWLSLTGREGLPIEDVRRIAIGPDGARWFATPHGLCRLLDGRWSYFQGRRWLPEDDVTDVACGADGTAYLRTRSGTVWTIRREGMTLARKAHLLLERLRRQHVRHGYVSHAQFAGREDTSTPLLYASDNDGLWTALYVAAESFRYAATGADDARSNARESAMALVRLQKVSGIPGFVARAVYRLGETNVERSAGEWHESPDRDWLWKGDTSSDELDGHFFGLSVFYELAADDSDREVVRASLQGVVDHLLANDYCLIDVDGLPTTWAVFSPGKLNHDPEWWPEKGLNSCSILAYLNTAFEMTADRRYRRAFEELVHEHHYLLNAVYAKILDPVELNHSDDELAFCAYWPLIRFERDPQVRALMLASLERSWQAERPERNPWFNYEYSILTGRRAEESASRQTLQELGSLGRIEACDNTRRADLGRMPYLSRDGAELADRVVPYTEISLARWNADPYALRWGGDGASQSDGVEFLLPYWMGRWAGFLSADE